MKGATDQIVLDGPPGVQLRSRTVQVLAMAVHELATNAVKHGALGQPQAQLSIRWSIEPPDARGQPWLHIEWRETKVQMPKGEASLQGRGQGRELIEEALPYQLSAKTSFDLGPDGVHCRISIPVSASSVRQEPGRG
jgi:two-component system, chemotaxis family, CheB/CheR fusion protein